MGLAVAKLYYCKEGRKVVHVARDTPGVVNTTIAAQARLDRRRQIHAVVAHQQEMRRAIIDEWDILIEQAEKNGCKCDRLRASRNEVLDLVERDKNLFPSA